MFWLCQSGSLVAVDTHAVLQEEDLPQPSLSTASSASIMSQQVPDWELWPDQASFVDRAGSALSTPRSLRPGTVPKLDLSPAIALHMAELVGGELEEQRADRWEEEGATQRQAAAMASFDDLSGPDSPDAASETASLAPAATASQAADDSMHAMADSPRDNPQVADHASTASSRSIDVLAAQALVATPASTAQSSLSIPSAHEAPLVVISSKTAALPGEASQASALVHQRETGSSSETDVDVSHSTRVPFRDTANAQATAVEIGSVAHVTESTALAVSAAHSPAPTQMTHPLRPVSSDEAFSAASSISEEIERESAYLSQEPSAGSDHLPLSQAALQAASSQAAASVSGLGLGRQTEATTEAAVEADEVQLSFGSPEADPQQASMPLLQPESVGVSSLPLLAGSIGKRDSEDKEQRHLAPDLLAYAEAAMSEAEHHSTVSSKAAGGTKPAHAVLISNTGAMKEAASHDAQVDKIAAELFDELLSDAVQSMTTTGESALHMLPLCALPHPASQSGTTLPLSPPPSSPAPCL